MSRPILIDNLCSLTLSTPGFDDLTLTGDNTDAWGNTFSIQACDEGTTWGTPIPVDVSVQRWMSDGAVASTQGFENREISFQVLLSATTTAALNAAESALALREAQSALLVWTSPEGDDLAPPSAFVIWTWHFDHNFDGFGERRLERLYTVTMTAEPWVRDTDLTTVAAVTIPGSPTVTEVDPCTSLSSGWTGSPNAATAVGGAIRETVVVPTAGHGTNVQPHLFRAGTVSGLGTTPYLMLDMSVTGGVVQTWSLFVDSVPATKAGQIGSVSWWEVPAGVTSMAKLHVTADVKGNKPGGAVILAIADLSKTDTVGGVGSRKQLTRSLAVGGSVPTSGSIQVASPSATPLGTVLLYTARDRNLGFNPGMRQYRSSGTTPIVDTSAVSGMHEAFAAGGAFAGLIQFALPAQILLEGSYVAVGRFKSSVVGSMVVDASSGVTGGPIVTRTAGTVTWTAPNTWELGILGVHHMPPQAMPVESGVSSFLDLISASSPPAGTVVLDEVWLLDVTHGSVSIVDCGEATQLWLDSPDASDRNLPAVYTGLAADRSDAVTPPYTQILVPPGDHDLDPQGTVLFTVTDNVDNAAVSASFYRRGHTHMPAA